MMFGVLISNSADLMPVIGVGDHYMAGTLSSGRTGQIERDRTRSEAEAFLKIHGVNTSAEVSVSPVIIKSVLQRSKEFLKDPAARELKLTVIAHWRFGLIAGGLASLLTVLYIVGLAMLGFQFAMKLIGFGVRGSAK